MNDQLLIVPWCKKTCQTNLNDRAVTRVWRVNLSSGFPDKVSAQILARKLKF